MKKEKLFIRIFLMGILILMYACTRLPATVDPDKIPSREPSDCPQLESQLYQMTQSENPLEMAEQTGLSVKDDKVQVLFVLVNNETDFLLEYDVDLGSQSGDQVQGYAPIDRLCELANLEAVLAIRRSAQPFLD